MLSSRSWPHLDALLKYDKAPYIVSSPRLVEEQCAAGDRYLCGYGLLSTRLDMALSGLMAELGGDFFENDVFPSRLTAAVDMLTAARIFLQPPQPGREEQENRIRLLAEETQEVLRSWAALCGQDNEQPFLFAAEEAAKLF